MVKTRSHDGDSKGKELDVEDPMESRLSRLEDMFAERSKMMKQFADMVKALAGQQLEELQSSNVLLEEKSKPQFQVIADPFIEPLECASNLKVPASVYDMDSHVKEMEEFPHQSTNGSGKKIAHQLFDQMPSKEKQRKCLKAWKFKFKPTSKRSKSMDVKFFSVEEFAWLTKDSKEINRGCVNKEFKEAVAGCGKKIFDRFKIVDETSKPAVYDGTIQIRVWDCGGSLLECVWWRRLKHHQCHGHEMQALEAENKSSETLGDHPFAPMKPYQSYAHPCLKCKAEMTIPLAKDTQNWIVNAWFKIQVFSDFDFASWIGLEIYCCETKKHMLLLMKLANRVWECGELLATHVYGKWLENCYKRDRVLKCYFLSEMSFIEFKTCKKELPVVGLRQHSLASMTFEQTYNSITEPKKILPSLFRLKHKWRSRLSHSFSEMKQRMTVSVWKSFGYFMEAHGSKYKGLGCVVEKKKLRNVEDGVKQDKNRFSGVVKAKILMALEELHLLQDVFEMVNELLLKTSLVIQQVMRSKKIKFPKRWMFKYKYVEDDIKSLHNQLSYKSRLELEERFNS